MRAQEPIIGLIAHNTAFFDIKYTRYDTDVEDVENAVREEMEAPGQLLGYRVMHHKICEHHQLHVPCNLFHDVMT